MKGDAKQLVEFLDGAKNRFIIPVYQRNYDWTKKQCKQLFDDLVDVIKNDRKSHFFGSIVSTHESSDSRSRYLIIDGQQRITTISLIFAALVNLLKKGEIVSSDATLCDQIQDTFIIDKYSKEERKLRLKPIKDDCEAFDSVVKGAPDEFVKGSNVTINYQYFCTRIKDEELSADEIYEAISRLEIIDIFVGADENPQLIFESLNSTGLDLTEADKIRNFILMGLDANHQEEYYEKYWNKIERLTNYQVSEFIRHYLTVKQRRIPKIAHVYEEYKAYVKAKAIDNTDKVALYGSVLDDMLRYATIYEKIINANTSMRNVNGILKRLNFIDVTVAYPFFMNLLARDLGENEVEESLKCVESFVFRRIMCPDYTTNALNKIFCTLDYDVERIKHDEDSYSSVLIYILENKRGNAGFPTDEEFATALRERDIYHMQKKNKAYLFDRLENRDNAVERVNVIEKMDANELTIEHIMPQTLTPKWKEMLGDDWQEVYNNRLHTLANLTLTGYNSKYSNKSFEDKKTCEKGFAESGLLINRILLDYDKWTSDEMNDRINHLVETATQLLWPRPETSFKPDEPAVDQVSLEDAEDLTGRTLKSYTLGDTIVHETKEWVAMFTEVIQKLYDEDNAPMSRLANAGTCGNLCYLSESDDEITKKWYKIDEGLYIYKGTSTAQKLSDLNKIFDAYERDKTDLMFNLEPETEAN